MDKEWRSDNWGNPYRADWPTEGRVIFEQGASAMLSALIVWLEGPCNRHLIPDDFVRGHQDFPRNLIKWNGFAWVYSHRKDCSQCWQKLKGEIVV
jgi:hypothetical protein